MEEMRWRILLLAFVLATPIFADPGAAERARLDSIRVSLEAQDLPLREALQKLVAQTGLQIVFHDGLVNDVKVSYECNNFPLLAALASLLKPAALAFEVTQDGQIVIVKHKINLKGSIKAAETGEALPFANVTIKGGTSGTSSNANGYFVLVNVPAGLCTLRVSYIGYQPVELPVAHGDDQEAIVISMKPQVLKGAAVTVTVDDLQTMDLDQDAGLLEVSARQMASLPSVGEMDVFRSLQLLPGISGVSDGSSALYVRGGTPEQNLVLLDGMTIYHVDHFLGFISAFNTDAIKNVHVFKGGFPAKFGGRVSSIVELTGKTGSYDQFQTGVSVNLLSGSGTVQMPISGRGAWLLSFRRSYTDLVKSDLYNNVYGALAGSNGLNDSHAGIISPAGAQPVPRRNDSRSGSTSSLAVAPASTASEFYYHDLTSKLSYSVSSQDILSMSFYNSRDNLSQPRSLSRLVSSHDSPNESVATVLVEDVTKWNNLGASGKWSRVWNDRLYSSVLGAYSVYANESHGAFGTAEATEGKLAWASNSSETNEVRDLSLQWQNEWHLSEAHKAEFGLELDRTNVGIKFTANDTVEVLQRSDEAVQTAFYLQDTWQALSPLGVTLGVRTTNYAPTKTTYVEPRASFQLALHRRLWLKGAWGEYHQFVNRIANENVLSGNRDFWFLADEKLAPSFAEHKILGMTWENPDFLMNVEAYHKSLEGIAEFSQRLSQAPGSQPAEFFLFGTGVAKGVEFIAQKKTGDLNGWASYTLASVDYRIPALNRGEAFPADQDRRHEIKLAGNYALGKWNLAATWVFASGTPYTAPEIAYAFRPSDASLIRYLHFGDKNASRLPAYHRMDISCSRQFSFENLNWEAGFSIFNLYDHRNVWSRNFLVEANRITVRDVTTMGFTPTVTLKVNLE